MGASFAKAIIPRRPMRSADRPSDWCLGWALPVGPMASRALKRVPVVDPIAEGADSAAALCLLEDGTKTVHD